MLMKNDADKIMIIHGQSQEFSSKILTINSLFKSFDSWWYHEDRESYESDSLFFILIILDAFKQDIQTKIDTLQRRQALI